MKRAVGARGIGENGRVGPAGLGEGGAPDGAGENLMGLNLQIFRPIRGWEAAIRNDDSNLGRGLSWTGLPDATYGCGNQQPMDRKIQEDFTLGWKPVGIAFGVTMGLALVAT